MNLGSLDAQVLGWALWTLAPEDLGTWPARVRLHVMDPTFRPVSVAPGYRPNSAASVHHQDFRGQGYPWTQMPAHPYKPKH